MDETVPKGQPEKRIEHGGMGSGRMRGIISVGWETLKITLGTRIVGGRAMFTTIEQPNENSYTLKDSIVPCNPLTQSIATRQWSAKPVTCLHRSGGHEE